MQTKARTTIAGPMTVALMLTVAWCVPGGASGARTSAARLKTQNPAAIDAGANVPVQPGQGVAKQAARANPASFTPEMPFGEAIDILRRSTRPPLNIVVLWKEIGDNAGLYRDTPIGIEGIPGLRVGQYLDMLLLSVSAGAAAKLGYTVEKGVVVIATTAALPTRYETRVYDVSDLVAEPARYFLPMMGFGAMGLGGMFGGMPMMGSYGGGFGATFMPGGGYPAGQGLTGVMNNLYGGTGRRSGTYRDR